MNNIIKYIMDNSVVDTIINTMFREHPANNVNEIEFSIVGQKGPGAPWNMGISKFRNLLTGLREATGIEPEHNIMLTVNVDDARVRIDDITEIQKFCVKNDPPLTHPNVTYEKKTREVAPIDMPEYGLRLRFSSERAITDFSEKQKINEKLKDRMTNKFYRYAQRYSIVSPKRFGSKGQLRVDFTSVRQNPGGDFRQAQLTGPGSMEHDRYEVEVELGGLARDEFFANEAAIRKELTFYLDFILRNLNGGMTVEPATETLTSLNKYLYTVAGLRGLSTGVEALRKAENLYQSTMISRAPSFVTVNITTMSMKHVVNDANGQTVLLGDGDEKNPIYVFTDKADGLRSLLFIDETGKASIIARSTIKQTRMVDGKERQSTDPDHILEVWPTGLKYEFKSDEEHGPYLLDGEFLWIQKRPYFLAFDILIHRNEDVTQRDFTARLALLGTAFNVKNTNETGLSVQAKQFYNYTIQTFKDLLDSNPAKLVRKMESHQLVGLEYNAPGGLHYKLDGLVFQPRAGPGSYFPVGVNTWNTVFKWKPSYMSTLDLRLMYDGQATPPIVTKTYEPTTLDGQAVTTTYAVFKAFANRSASASPYMCCAKVIDGVARTETEDGSLGEPIRKGMIVECRLSVENVGTGDMHWAPIRVRHDKSQPNDIRVYTDLVNTVINEPITLDHLAVKGGGRGGSTRLLVNTVNRDISNKIIVDEIVAALGSRSQIDLLDLGCGTLKSGTAWTKLSESRPVKVIGIDIIDVGQANINLRGYMKKFNSKFTAEFVHGNFNTDLAVQPNTGRFFTTDVYNVVTCTFAIHYSMATEDSFRAFVKNVSRNLELGGVFIGAYMNKSLILADMKKKKTVKLGSTGDRNPLWQIQLVSGNADEAETQIFGSAVKVSFTELYQNNVEYLINMEDPTVKRILSDAGLTLKKHQPFNSYSEASRITVELERQWLSYHYMFVFEKTHAFKPSAPVPVPEAPVAVPEAPVAEVAPAPVAEPATETAPVAEAEPSQPVKKARIAIKKPVTKKSTQAIDAPPAIDAPAAIEAPVAKPQIKLKIKPKTQTKEN